VATHKPSVGAREE